ncbi:HAMP domain protein [Campylobacter rectus RM3267]|uniref:histidine kinase n=2 Tax=Campylobacter rectus TaxID=203 RepID=A0A6G5QKJ6_CAMRE|nr:ArsS family sensor histidine kinase [Campylobacter rectus]EEF13584.1 HAMP domain protein [Campylobacter rectus RM3267]QCD46149.1 two-component system sensor histidine kinase [Campylobacter rectus]UEB46863.1 ArsS family sensor histidine kinase [Campylobacter rectus]
MRYSLTTKITVVFALAFSLVCILFYTFANIQLDNALEKIKNKQLNAINYLIASYEKSNPPSDLTIYFRNFGLTYVKSDKTVANVLSGGKTIFAKQTQLGLFQSLLFQDSLYLQIKNPSFQILLESDDTKNINDPIWVGFILTSALLISLYVSVINSLMPLKKLSSDIRKFGAGNMDVNIAKPDSNDEIAKVAIEFDAAASKIRELLRSRQLFLRTIMHELKTPIGKGRIVSEMVQNETHKSRLIAIFERLDMLINEFGKIEQLLSKNYALNYQESYFSNILEQARDMLMLDKFEEKVSVDIRQDILLRVDFGLFSLAIKNLIDNALKYADDKKAQVICDKDGIVVRNLGKPLQNPIEYYLQAFIREKGNKSGGMGLGLYIIDHICQMHKFSLKYSYEDGYHAFKICTKPKESVEKRA